MGKLHERAENDRLKSVLEFRDRALRLAEQERDLARAERDEMAMQATACAEEVDRVRVEIGAVQAEVERLKGELAAVNNEFGSQTPDWPEAWKRVADLKQLAGDRWRENVDLKEQIHVLTTALAESERKRVEAEEERKAECDRSKKISAAFERYCKSVLNMQDFHRGALDCGIQRDAAARIWSSAQAHRRDRLAFTPTQETTHVES